MESGQDFKELFECFNVHEVRYQIIGAFTLAWHGHIPDGDNGITLEFVDGNV